MHLHEYQAKDLLTSYQLPIPSYRVAASVPEAEAAIQAEQWRSGVVKAQVHSGGRGKKWRSDYCSFSRGFISSDRSIAAYAVF